MIVRLNQHAAIIDTKRAYDLLREVQHIWNEIDRLSDDAGIGESVRMLNQACRYIRTNMVCLPAQMDYTKEPE